MERRKILAILVLVLGLMVFQTRASEAAEMGTTCTYRGYLLDSNSAGNGIYDFQFKLFDDPNIVLGNQLGSTINVNEMDIVDGHFTAILDFESSIFDGNAVWLEISVRPSDSEPSVYAVLGPRQEVTNISYPLHAQTSIDLKFSYEGIVSGSDTTSSVTGIGTYEVGHFDTENIYNTTTDNNEVVPDASFTISTDHHSIEFVDSGQRLGFSNSATMSVAVADVNNDGYLDIVFGNYYWAGLYPHAGEVHLNQGDGTFVQTSQELKTGNWSWYSYECSVATGDVDGDLDIDLVISDAATGPEDRWGLGDRVLLNRGNGLFDYGQSLDKACTRFDKLADLDGDGNLDLLIGESNYNYSRGWSDHSGILTYLNDGTGNFPMEPEQVLGIGTSVGDIAASDLDGDGYLDLVSGNWRPECLFMNDGSGHFEVSPEMLDSATHVACSDLDSDGYIDIISDNRIFLNDGTAGFTLLESLPDSSQRGIAVGDIDLDGDIDCILGSVGSILNVYLNDGSGHFSLAERINIPSEGSSLGLYCFALADVDNDSDLDFVLGMFLEHNLVFLNTAADNQPPVADAGGPYIAQATSWSGAWVDLDGTGSSDPDGDALRYEWDLDLSADSNSDGDPNNDTDANEPTPEMLFPIGQTEISLVVIDEYGLRSEPDVTTVTVSSIEADVDIRPGSFPNAINLGSHGVIPVAFLTDEAFDASTVDPATVTLRGEDFADGMVKLRGKKDAPVPMSNLEDVDGDGDWDLVVHLDTEKIAEHELEAICEIGALTFDTGGSLCNSEV
jgi:hypothetical protein